MIISQERFNRIYRENKVQCTCLVLIINNECNADCVACIAGHVFKSPLCKEVCEAYQPKCLRCCDHTASDEQFYARLEDILGAINSPIVDVIITGGEPTISNRLIPTLELVAKYDYPIKTLEMETNGARLADPQLAEALEKHKVLIHLSRYGITDEENDAEFRFKYSRVGAEEIQGFAARYGDRLGTSTVLLNNHISTGEDLLRFIDFYDSLGVRNHAFQEVMADVSLRTANKAMLDYYDAHVIPILKLSKELEQLGCPKIAEMSDESYRILTHTYSGRNFTLSSSDLERQHRQETNNEFSRFLIMPSGEIGVNGIEKR